MPNVVVAAAVVVVVVVVVVAVAVAAAAFAIGHVAAAINLLIDSLYLCLAQLHSFTDRTLT